MIEGGLGMVEIDNNPLTAIARSDGAKSEAAGTTRTSGGCGERLGGATANPEKGCSQIGGT